MPRSTLCYRFYCCLFSRKHQLLKAYSGSAYVSDQADFLARVTLLDFYLDTTVLSSLLVNTAFYRKGLLLTSGVKVTIVKVTMASEQHLVVITIDEQRTALRLAAVDPSPGWWQSRRSPPRHTP